MGFESDLSGLLRQVPPIMYVMFFGSIVLMIIVITAIVLDRRRRAQLSSAGPAVQNFSMASDFSDQDLPDIDSLTVSASPAPSRGQGGVFTLTLASGERVDAAEVMTIYRDVAEGGLLVQIGTQVYRHPPASADSEFKRRFAATVRDLSSVIATPPPAAKAESAAPVPPPAPAPRATGEIPGLRMPPAAVPLPGDLPKFKMPDVVEPPKRGRRRPPSEPIPEINIAQAIEDYLQFKLASTDRFPGRQIHVRSAAGGGLRIEVDQASYETVADVADADVRTFLQESIEEWQSRQ